MVPINLPLACGLLYLSHAAAAEQLDCNTNAIPVPEYFGTKVLTVTATDVRGFEGWPMFDLSGLQYERNAIDFCNVTLTYTHPGLGDSVNVYVWLPLDNWNGNFFGQGGGGWAAGAEGQ